MRDVQNVNHRGHNLIVAMVTQTASSCLRTQILIKK